MDLSNRPIKESNNKNLTVGSVLTTITLASEIGGKYKAFILAGKFNDGGVVELDEADFALVKKGVEDTQAYGRQVGSIVDWSINTLISGRLIQILEKAKLDKEGKK